MHIFLRAYSLFPRYCSFRHVNTLPKDLPSEIHKAGLLLTIAIAGIHNLPGLAPVYGIMRQYCKDYQGSSDKLYRHVVLETPTRALILKPAIL